ncbi:MAG: precorrin-6y C5,15-methyltransferase (decarboxylating) subunit CbiE [Xenococcaceae cyanobacterium MO_188.B19]|nr:precorrin-6y C5,15-methyltransferase (decarboxylating) subunit CbiE [Xenococcaceae cyanobacterium MO_188.B19]
MSQIEVIGIGLDGISGLNSKTLDLVKSAQFLIGSSRQLSYFSSYSGHKITLGDLQQGIEQILDLISQETNKSIVILASGDPLFFGLGRLLLSQIPPEKLRFHPHISSLQLAFSRVKIPWQDAKIISVHGRSPETLIKYLKQGTEKIAVLTDTQCNPTEIAKLCLDLDIPVKYDFYICENLAGEDEKITYFASEDIEKLASLKLDSFSSLNILILLRSTTSESKLELDSLPKFGLPDSIFSNYSDRPGLITKKEIRIAILGQLELQSSQVVWDIGAGTGSVSIEIARLCPKSQIFAVEKTAIGYSLIKENCQRFQVDNIQVLNGKAPEILLDLPNPDRVFIGGSGGNLESILELCSEKLLPEGLLVIALATVEHCYEALNWIKTQNWHYNLLQLQISRSTSIANLTRLSPLNPVTLIKTYPSISKAN